MQSSAIPNQENRFSVATIVIEEVIIHDKEGASYFWKQIYIPMVHFQDDALLTQDQITSDKLINDTSTEIKKAEMLPLWDDTMNPLNSAYWNSWLNWVM
jgi:hypothetical protein